MNRGKRMDEADYAAREEQRDRDRAMAVRRPALIVPATGECLNCRAIVPPGVRWCDADCRVDWSLRHERGRA